jgi:hypothetical protein
MKMRRSTGRNSKIRGDFFYGCPEYLSDRPAGIYRPCSFFMAEDWQRPRVADAESIYNEALANKEQWAVEIQEYDGACEAMKRVLADSGENPQYESLTARGGGPACCVSPGSPCRA